MDDNISRNVSQRYGQLLLGVLFCVLYHMVPLTVTNVCQERIAKAHGSQCGFCTPGIVMSMYALLRNNPTPQMAEVEEAFHGTPRHACTFANQFQERHITAKTMLCFYFPFQEICAVAPAIDPSWRGSRLLLWSVNRHKN